MRMQILENGKNNEFPFTSTSHDTSVKSFDGLGQYSSSLAHRLEDLFGSLNRQTVVAMRSITLASRHQKKMQFNLIRCIYVSIR